MLADTSSTDRERHTKHGAHGEAVRAGIAGAGQYLVAAHCNSLQTSERWHGVSRQCRRLYPSLGGVSHQWRSCG